MGFLSRIKGAMRETEETRRYADTAPADRPVTVYAEDDYSWNQLEGYVRRLTDHHGRNVAYVTSQPDDPILAEPPPGVSPFSIKESVSRFVPRIDSAVFLTTMPDLDTFHIKRPRDAVCAYVFHSLNSTHMTYRTGAFDAYDVICCTGPYQKRELEARYREIGKTGYELAEVGYYKLDRVAGGFAGHRPAHPDDTTILVAPSWGQHNLLASCGEDVVASLAAEGFRTVVRPHPAFFESIYPEGRRIVARLQERFAGDENVVFETSITTESSFYEAAVMVSDWSGAAFEYALGTVRPVLFVDVRRKAFNPAWDTYGIVPFEDRMRHEVGAVLSPDRAMEAGKTASDLIAAAYGYADRIVAARDREIYNFGGAARAGAAVVDAHAG